jgi:cytochrome c peroxidase
MPRWMIAGLALAACSGASTASSPADGGEDAAAPQLSEETLATLRTLSPTTLPRPPRDVTNAFADDPRAAALGQKLFFDAGFSGRLLDGDNDGGEHALGKQGETGKVSCAGCHTPSAGFLDDRTLGKQISLGSGWGRRRAPSLLDVGQTTLLMWDGRHDALYNQVFGPLESPVEMNGARLYVAEQVFARYRAEYEAIFGALPPLDDAARFPALGADLAGCHPTGVDTKLTCEGTMHGIPGDGAEFDRLAPADQDAVTRVVVNVGKAIGAYERLLSCGPGRFDAWMHGKSDALSPEEQRGAGVFVRAGCAGCHSGPFFSDQKFHNVGMKPTLVAVTFLDANDEGAKVGLEAALADPLSTKGKFSDGDDGRLPASVTRDHIGAFRTPMLRCVSRRPAFMHTGQLRSLESVIAFFDRGGDEAGYPGKNELHALGLAPRDRADLLAFLATLDGPGPEARLLTPPTP